MQLSANPEAPFTDAERAAILEQLDRMLGHSQFRHSRRFPALLRYVVQTTLEGHADVLKERTLGVEIFKKRAQYDTATDPIVRVTAAELRKRIALYYGEPGHESELRLTLPPGSYVPRFGAAPAVQESAPLLADILPKVRTDPAGSEVPDPAAPVVVGMAVKPEHRASAWRLWLALGIVVLSLLAVALLYWRERGPGALQAFWAPMLNSSDPVLFCVADQTEYTNIELRDAAQPTRQAVLPDNLTAVVIDDLAPIADIAGLLRQNGKRFLVRGEGATTMNDLRNGPSIFIGAYDNAWTLRLLKSQRFHFANDPEMNRFWIVDNASTRPTPWLVDRKQQLATNIYRDYAIVSRFGDSDTGRPALVIAGIGRGGTIAAGEFLTTESLLNELAPELRSSKKNVELVLSTQIIGGQPGTPRIEASYTW